MDNDCGQLANDWYNHIYKEIKLENFWLYKPVNVTEENILKGDCGIESCPIALALEGELPEGWKINVMRGFISVFDKEMHETQYVNTEFVTRWIQTFDGMFEGYVAVDDDGNDVDIKDFEENLLCQAPPFKIVLTKTVDENGNAERWAKEVFKNP